MKEKYMIYCGKFTCAECPLDKKNDIRYCDFTGTKAQVKAFIKRHFKQPKIKKVVGK